MQWRPQWAEEPPQDWGTRANFSHCYPDKKGQIECSNDDDTQEEANGDPLLPLLTSSDVLQVVELCKAFGMPMQTGEPPLHLMCLTPPSVQEPGEGLL